MKINALIVVLSLSMFATDAFALSCSGHMVNGYTSSDYGYKKYQSMTVTFESCEWYIPNSLCNDVYLNGQKKSAYWAEGKFMFFEPSGTFTEKTGHLVFKMREAAINVNPNEGERWFEGICK